MIFRICGREPLYIAVEIDTFNDVMEVREDNNIAAIPLSVTGCKGTVICTQEHNIIERIIYLSKVTTVWFLVQIYL